MIRILRSGENIGDVPALKLTLISDREDPSPHSEAALSQVERNFSPLDPDALAALPEGSFGRAYASFMKRNGLMPFNFSSRTRALFERYPVSIRYVRLHDMIHVLLGFEPDLAGEAGVYAFVAEQHYTPTLDRAAGWSRRFARLLFWARSRMDAAQTRGKRLAAGARILVNEPLEEMLELPLSEVRARLGIRAPMDAPLPAGASYASS